MARAGYDRAGKRAIIKRTANVGTDIVEAEELAVDVRNINLVAVRPEGPHLTRGYVGRLGYCCCHPLEFLLKSGQVGRAHFQATARLVQQPWPSPPGDGPYLREELRVRRRRGLAFEILDLLQVLDLPGQEILCPLMEAAAAHFGVPAKAGPIGLPLKERHGPQGAGPYLVEKGRETPGRLIVVVAHRFFAIEDGQHGIGLSRDHVEPAAPEVRLVPQMADNFFYRPLVFGRFEAQDVVRDIPYPLLDCLGYMLQRLHELQALLAVDYSLQVASFRLAGRNSAARQPFDDGFQLLVAEEMNGNATAASTATDLHARAEAGP
jgi:hypothetical protein